MAQRAYRQIANPLESPVVIRFGAIVRLVGILAALILFMLMNFLLYQESTMPGLGLRYLVIPVLVLLMMLFVWVRYIQFTYRLSERRMAFKYLTAALLGIGYPNLVISDGKKKIDPGEENLIDIVGGPGYLSISPGNIAVLESLTGAIRVLGPGRHFISQYETVKETISLDERHAGIERITAITKDGIEVEVTDIRYRYRLAGESPSRGVSIRSPEDPYPYSREAAITMTYNRNVTAMGVSSWHQGVNTLIESVVTDYIRGEMVDHLTAPSIHGSDPRGEICSKLKSEAVRMRLREQGAELLWIDIGHFGFPNRAIPEQRVSTWRARWEGDANIVRAFGEAKRLAYQELGEAEAQAEMLLNIIHALEDVSSQGEARQHMRAVYLSRIAQVLDAIGRQQIPPGENPT